MTAPWPTIEPREFVRTVQPVLERKDLSGLHELLKSRWTAEQIISLFNCDDCDARKIAALSLSLVGCTHCLQPLSKQLKDPDPMVNQMAEHAMWAIWFRGENPDANHQLARGALAMARRDFDHAIRHFDRAIELSPTFPEPYNQKAIAQYLLERFDAAIVNSRKAVDLMPLHFGAWAGMGHCHTHLGQFRLALKCYEEALAINPHLNEIAEAVAELKCRLSCQHG